MVALKTMPLDFCPSEEELRVKLIARGRRWSSLTGIVYKQFGGKKVPVRTRVPIEVSFYQYTIGPTHFTSWSANDSRRQQASGRIMIDAAAFFDKNPNVGLCRRPALQPPAEGSEVDDMGESDVSVQLSDEKCLLVSGVLRGFDLKTKDWCKWNPGL